MSNQSKNTQNLPTTPDWSKAPKWANYFAIDSNGFGYWHEKEPFRIGASWHNYASLTKAGLFNSIDWERSFRRRPKIEGVQPDEIWTDEVVAVTDGLKQRSKPLQITFNFNTDKSGYLAGKNSFITGLVDLLLARMAKEERYSESELFSSEPVQVNDIVVFESEYDNRTCYGLVDAVADSNWAATAWIGRVMEYIDGEWCHRRGKIFDLEEISIRPINELEAVEFRTAMEAVYG